MSTPPRPANPHRRVAVIGAGIAGLSAAKILTEVGVEVTVFEKTHDIGGVWSATRRYPGLTTQNDAGTYALSDYPMPRGYPEWPSGQQVQEYLDGYVEHFGLASMIQLNTEVVAAELDETAGTWTLSVRDVRTACQLTRMVFDHLLVANGIFSDPFVPDLPGAATFRASGGRLCHASEIHGLEDATDRHVLVVGYGKSACDIAVALSDVAASTTIVARELLWKLPKQFSGLLNSKYLLLNRLGEALFRYIRPVGLERFLHGPGRPVRDAMLGTIQALVVRQLRLRELGLLPAGSIERIARSTVSLATDGFAEKVASGAIAVRRDSEIHRLVVQDGQPSAELDGSVVPADLVVCGTGFHQRVPFLDEHIQQRITDQHGNFELYRQILPHDVPRLTFCGYNSSFFSPLSAEVASLWIASHLHGRIALPPLAARREHVRERLRWMEERTEGRHARGTNIIPFSMHNIDEMLGDIGVGLGRWQRFLEWVAPVRPGAYARIIRATLERHRDWSNPRAAATAPAHSQPMR